MAHFKGMESFSNREIINNQVSDHPIQVPLYSLPISGELACSLRHCLLQSHLPWPTSLWLCHCQHQSIKLCMPVLCVQMLSGLSHYSRHCSCAMVQVNQVGTRYIVEELPGLWREGSFIHTSQIFCQSMPYDSSIWVIKGKHYYLNDLIDSDMFLCCGN